MEAAAMDRLIEKGGATGQFAQAIGEALDITLKAANFVTVPVLDARFAEFEAKMEARFGSLERGLESAKVWAVLLYAGLTVVFFGALAVEHRWLVDREDQFMERMQARADKLFAEERAQSDRLFAEDQARSDKLFAEEHARSDRLVEETRGRSEKLIAEQRAHADEPDSRLNTELDQLRALRIKRSPNP